MHRRALLAMSPALATASVITLPATLRVQTAAVPASGPSTGQRTGAATACIGAILTGDASHPSLAALRESLTELGHVEGQTFHLEPRFDGGQLERLPALATELVSLQPDVIAAVGAVQTRAVQRATSNIPILFAVVVDPVSVGLISDLRRPVGNSSGVTDFDPGQASGQIAVLKQALPGLQRLAIMSDAGVPDALPNANRAAAEAAGLHPQVLLLREEAELDRAFAAMQEQRADALLALSVPYVTRHGARIARMAEAARLPSMFGIDSARFVPLLAYGTGLAAATRRMAVMVDRVLKGESPGEIPVEQIVQPQLIVNLKVARAIGVTLPQEILARARQVVE